MLVLCQARSVWHKTKDMHYLQSSSNHTINKYLSACMIGVEGGRRVDGYCAGPIYLCKVCTYVPGIKSDPCHGLRHLRH